MRPKSRGTFKKRTPGACFSKVPKLFGSISGTTVPLIFPILRDIFSSFCRPECSSRPVALSSLLSSQRRGSKPSNFAILLNFFYIKNMLKDQLFETSGLQFDNWLFGSEKFSGLSRNRPKAKFARSMVIANRR